MSTTLVQAQKAMSLYGLSIFYSLGTIGNFLLILILMQRTHRRNPCALYLLAATIVNFILIQCVLPAAIASANSTDPQHLYLPWCKIRSYLFNALLMLYRWYKIAACIDRAAMFSPHVWIRSFSDVRVAYRVILIITIVWLLIPIHLAVYFRIESGRCGPESSVYAKFFSVYSTVVSGWSPPIIMAAFVIIAYRSLKQVRTAAIRITVGRSVVNDRVSNNTRRGYSSQRLGKRDRQLIMLLICEVILYVCTNLLYSVNITYSAITLNTPKSRERLQVEWFVSYFTTPFLIIINNCAPFYLYLIVSSKFRHDVKKLFTFCWYSSTRVQPERSNGRLTTTSQAVVTTRDHPRTVC